MRLALVPLNPTVGDLRGNEQRIAAAAAWAADRGADLLVTPELALCGYPPKDLLLQEGFVADAMERARRLAGVAGGMTIVVGCPWLVDGRSPEGGVANALLALRDGAIVARYDKRLLPTYDVFDEDRYFRPGAAPAVVDVGGVRVGLSVCEDLWRGADAGALARYAGRPDPVLDLVRAGAAVIVNPSASPFVMGKARAHRRILLQHAATHGVAIVAVNQCGGNDDLVFDGHASVVVPDPTAPAGARLAACGGLFLDAPVTLDLPPYPRSWAALPAAVDPFDGEPEESLLFRALVLGVRDYCRKTGFSRVTLGLSGGIDSAVTCCIAVAALGARNVVGLRMPGRYSSEGSLTDAAALASALGVRTVTVPIHDMHDAVARALAPGFADVGADRPGPGDVTDENAQSRLRGLTLMAFSNRTGALALTTGNKSELAVGYCTLYGDMNGGLAALSDVTKAWVYRLARWINANPAAVGCAKAPIPDDTINKPPSAELRPDQTDQDSLPPYDEVDAILERYVERRESPARIARETGIDPATVQRVVRLIDASEFKRRQAAPGIKVTGVAFGVGRRIPVAQGWRPAVGEP